VFGPFPNPIPDSEGAAAAWAMAGRREMPEEGEMSRRGQPEGVWRVEMDASGILVYIREGLSPSPGPVFSSLVLSFPQTSYQPFDLSVLSL